MSMSTTRRPITRLRQSVLYGGLVLTMGAALAVTAAGPSKASLSSEGQADRAMSRMAEDDEVVLPARVANVINRTDRSLDRAEAAIDDGRRRASLKALRAVRTNVARAYRAGLHQMAAGPADEEAETTPGPDSVVAVLTMDQAAITRQAGLYDQLRRPRVVRKITAALRATLIRRQQLLNAVVRLDPEGAGADYADGMADTVDGYTDEMAGLTDALRFDRLTPAARRGLTMALSRSRAANTKVTTAFGGGE